MQMWILKDKNTNKVHVGHQIGSCQVLWVHYNQ